MADEQQRGERLTQLEWSGLAASWRPLPIARQHRGDLGPTLGPVARGGYNSRCSPARRCFFFFFFFFWPPDPCAGRGCCCCFCCSWRQAASAFADAPVEPGSRKKVIKVWHTKKKNCFHTSHKQTHSVRQNNNHSPFSCSSS